jgi:hypothetical protein
MRSWVLEAGTKNHQVKTNILSKKRLLRHKIAGKCHRILLLREALCTFLQQNRGPEESALHLDGEYNTHLSTAHPVQFQTR